MGNKFWILLRAYCLESTLTGLQYFYLYPDVVSRCFWALNLISAISLSGFITWLLYSHFLEMPTQVTIENQYESMMNMPYPTITLCSPTQITVSSLKHFNKSLVDGVLTTDLEEILPQLNGFYGQMHQSKEADLIQLQNVLELNRYTIPEVMASLALSCERFLKRCIFKNQLYDCKDLFQPIITTHGYCCAFNSQYYFDGQRITRNPLFKNHTVQEVGFIFSLTVVSDYEPNEVLKDTLHNGGATRVLVTDASEFPIDFESVSVDSNAEVIILLRAVFKYCSEDVRLLPSWSRECYFEHEKRLPFFKYYRNSDCYISCYAEALREACHCVPFTVPGFPEHNTCKLTDIPCITNFMQSLSWFLIPDQCKCPCDCEFRKYSMDLNLGNFHGLAHLIDSMNPYKGLTFNESSSIFKFVFSSPVYVKRKEETKMSYIIFISNLGGVFGLSLGCSGISLLEIFFYIYRGIKSLILTNIQQRRNATG